jgi:acyl-[acyl carrier protein]--UDP-N-acetylglucosamine O-acyltransferase
MRPTGIHSTAVIGSPPEHRDWQEGEDYYYPAIDATARINAFVTVDGGLRAPTKVGARSFVMAGCHIGHDAIVGEDCELAPKTVLGGHVQLGNKVRCGVGVLIKPFVKVGDGARLGMGAVVNRDVPPGEVWVGNPAEEISKFKNRRLRMVELEEYQVEWLERSKV